MKLWAADRFEIETPMSADAIIAALRAEVEPTKWFRRSREHKRFQGHVGRDDFKIMRIIHYQNSFIPVIKGRLQRGVAKNVVSIEMRLHAFVMAFLCVWFGGAALGTVLALSSPIRGEAGSGIVCLLPLGMLIVGWALVVGAFWFEANKAKPLLVATLNGTIRERTRPSTVTSTRGTPAAGAPGAPGFRSGHG